MAGSDSEWVYSPPPTPTKKTAAPRSTIAPPSNEEEWVYSPPPKSDGGISGAVDELQTDLKKYVGEPVAKAAGLIGYPIERFSAAPAREFVSKAVEGKPFEGMQAAGSRLFGGKPEEAPTGYEIAKKTGLSDTRLSDVFPSGYDETGSGFKFKKGGLLDPSPAGAAGLLVDVGADPSAVVPLGALAKGGLRAAGVASREVAAPIAKGAGSVARTSADALTGDLRLGSAVSEAGSSAKSAAENILNKYIAPKQALEYPESVRIAKKHGINPELLSESVEFGESSTPSRMARSMRETPLGEKSLLAHRQASEQISEAIKNAPSKISAVEPFRTTQEAGEYISGAVKAAQDRTLGGMDMTYRKALDYAPGLYLNPESQKELSSVLSGIEKRSKGLQRRGVLDQPSMGKRTQSVTDSVRKLEKGGRISYKQLLDQMQYIGQAAFDSSPVLGRVPDDVKELKKLYFAMSDSLVDTVRRDVNPEFAQEILANNKKMTQFFKDQEVLKHAFDESKSPEAVFNHVVNGADSRKIGALKSILADNPDAFNAIRKSYVDNLISKNTNAKGFVNFESLANQIRKDKAKLTTLLSPEEIQDLAEVTKLGVDQGPAFMSSSGTSQAASFHDMSVVGLLNAVKNKGILEGTKAAGRGRGLLQSASLLPGGMETAGQVQKALPASSPFRDTARGLLGKKRGKLESAMKRGQSIQSIDRMGQEREE